MRAFLIGCLMAGVALPSLFGQAVAIPHMTPDGTGGGPAPSSGGPVVRELFVTTDRNTPGPETVVMNSTGNTLLVVDFTSVIQNAPLEFVKVSELALCEKTTASKPSFYNVGMFNGSMQIAVSLPPQASATPTCPGYIYGYPYVPFSLFVPPNGSTAITFRADTASANSGGAVDGIYQFQILDPTSIVARGAVSNYPFTVSAIAQGNPIRVVETTLAVSSTAAGNINLSASSAGDTQLNSLTLAFYSPVTGQPVNPTSNPVSLRLLPSFIDPVEVGWATVVAVGNQMTWIFENPS